MFLLHSRTFLGVSFALMTVISYVDIRSKHKSINDNRVGNQRSSIRSLSVSWKRPKSPEKRAVEREKMLQTKKEILMSYFTTNFVRGSNENILYCFTCSAKVNFDFPLFGGREPLFRGKSSILN